MENLTRRTLLLAIAATTAPVAWGGTRRQKWKFNSLGKVGGHAVQAHGAPQLIKSPDGPAVLFDGQDDVLFIEHHPLAGASTFTAELIFRPDGGAFEQRLLHLESAEPQVAPGKGGTRMLIEIRVVDNHWYLDAFMVGAGYRATMMAPDKLFPIGRWYHAAATYDGHSFRSYVNGVLQMEMATPFSPQGPGRTSVGARMNQVTHFKGAIHEARFTGKALPAKAFMQAPR